ncbi:hypothetical protein [Novosphingobium sp. BL-52-GroH]|uniref:hypothetical protein n=1 Tax=Novosphingobium sp. BL-52-GroH TaxID=3349877 RepID=UPI00384BA3D3
MASHLANRAAQIRSIDRAKAALKDGDRIAFTSCPGTARTATFTGWDGNWICCKTRNDIAARSIFKLNGLPVSFADPPWERYDPATGRPFGDHGTAAQALHWALNVYEDPSGGLDFLQEWQQGGAWEEWFEFYEWLEPWPAERPRRGTGALAAADIDG